MHDESRRWVPHPRLAQALRLGILAAPVVVAIAATVAVAAAVSRPSSTGGALLWWLLLLAVATGTVVAVDRVARRLLPLTAMLRLALVFPDRAPSRIRLALQAGSTRVLRQQVHDHPDEPPARAAARVLVLAHALGRHDAVTRGHSERVRALTDVLGGALGLDADARDRLRWAGLLHDIGKIRVPAVVLNKRTALDDSDWDLLRQHPAQGAAIAAPLRPFLGEWADTIGQHHERWNGSGYPDGLAGDDICLGARIVAVADAFEVMTSPRSYRTALPPDVARAEIVACAGTHFDPGVARALLGVGLGRLRAGLGILAWLGAAPFVDDVGAPDAQSVGIAGHLAPGVGVHPGASAPSLSGHPSSPSYDDGGGGHHDVPLPPVMPGDDRSAR